MRRNFVFNDKSLRLFFSSERFFFQRSCLIWSVLNLELPSILTLNFYCETNAASSKIDFFSFYRQVIKLKLWVQLNFSITEGWTWIETLKKIFAKIKWNRIMVRLWYPRLYVKIILRSPWRLPFWDVYWALRNFL